MSSFYVVFDPEEELFEPFEEFMDAVETAREWSKETPDREIYLLQPVRRFVANQPTVTEDLVDGEDCDA